MKFLAVNVFAPLLACMLVGACAMLSQASPAETAADALKAEHAAHRAAVAGCAAYEAALVAKLVKADPEVTGQCAALKD